MMMVPCCKLFYCACGMFKWERLSQSGRIEDWVNVLHVSANTMNQAGGSLRTSTKH
jgi:hypothetical protein